MKPPAPVSGDMSIDIARMPCGRIAAMKPPPLAATTLGSRIGSPASDRHAHDGADEIFDGVRPIGLSDEIRLAEAAGQVCQPTSRAPTTWPVSRSVLAINTSTVASGGGGGRRLGRLGRVDCRSPAWRQRRQRQERQRVRSGARLSLRSTSNVT